MFTGIVQTVGKIVKVDGHRVAVSAQSSPDFLSDVRLGDSIAINGACMTVVAQTSSVFEFDVSRESLDRTVGLNALGPVNLEKAMRASDRLGGHMVSGHVDGIAVVTSLDSVAESWRLAVLLPTGLSAYVTEKGSIAINGVSLTVNTVDDTLAGTEISVNLIPHTWHNTSLQFLKKDDRVNIEVDQVAKQVARVVERLQTLKKI